MRWSAWRAKAPFKDSVVPRILSVVDDALAGSGRPILNAGWCGRRPELALRAPSRRRWLVVVNVACPFLVKARVLA
jgi:hypothetical protein